MATESIGSLVPTAIPGYEDAADIQAALRAYHYGSYSYSPANTSPASLVNPSIAYTITDLQSQITALGTGGIAPTIFTAKGGLITATAANTPVQLSVGGSNGMVLTVNSATDTGLEWAVPAVTLTNSVTLTNKTLTSPIVTGLTLNDSSIIFEGSSADANETTLTVINPTADRTISLPNVTGTIITTGDTSTVTNTMLAGSIANNKLANSTISGVSLGSNLNTLTISTGLTGTSYNGSSAVTMAVDTNTISTKAYVNSTVEELEILVLMGAIL